MRRNYDKQLLYSQSALFILHEVHGNEKLFYTKWWKKQQTPPLPGKNINHLQWKC